MLDENVRSIKPAGLALAILVVSLVCLAAASLAVALRTYTRWKEHTFGLDDSLMVAGLVSILYHSIFQTHGGGVTNCPVLLFDLSRANKVCYPQVIYAVDVGLASHGTFVGLGTRTAELSSWLAVEGLKYLMLWMMVYIISLAVIKGSICVTLYRIASADTRYKVAVFTLLGLTIATMLVTLLGVLFLCRPVSANWTGEGECAGASTLVALSYTSTASTIVTDLSLAVLPGFMIWGSLMDPRQKILVCVLLSFGSMYVVQILAPPPPTRRKYVLTSSCASASIATMIRAPYIQHYWTPTDNLDYWTGYIVLLSNVESAIGCIASSAPAFRKFGRSRKNNHPSGGSSSQGPARPKSLVTFGSLPVRNNNYSSSKLFHNPTDQGVSFASVQAGGQGNKWNRLPDGSTTDATSDCSSSSRDEDLEANGAGAGTGAGIRAEYTYEVELSHIKS